MSDPDGATEPHQLIAEAAQQGTDAIARAVHGPMGANGEANPDLDEDENAVIEHLLFHRALTDHDPDRLREYLGMARNEVASFRNRFDRAIALTFHLVLDEEMDPWSIDLANFSSLYAERLRDTPHVDLITGGRLLAMAWGILLAQTDELLARADPEEEEEEDPLAWDAMHWDEMPGAWADEPADPDTQYTNHVLDEDNDPPISESVFHQGDRRVTLYELVEALEEGRRDAERRKRLAEERRKAREQAQEDNEQASRDVGDKVHKEDLEAEIGSVRGRMQRLEEPTPMDRIHNGTRDDFLTVFVSSLFLSRAHMTDVDQEAFPYTPIIVTPRPALSDPDAPLVGLPKDAGSFDDLAEANQADHDAAEPSQDAPAEDPPDESSDATQPKASQ